MRLLLGWLAVTMVFSSQAVATPPCQPCEEDRGAWCYFAPHRDMEMQRTHSDEGATWLLQMPAIHGGATLAIAEPKTCSGAYADTVERLGEERDVYQDGARWDIQIIRLRADGSCDLTLKVPADNQSLWVQNALYFAISPTLNGEAYCTPDRLAAYLGRWELGLGKSE
jgi:hypothetical protein